MSKEKEFDSGAFLDRLGKHMNDLLDSLEEQPLRATSTGLTVSHTLKNCAEAYQAVVMTELAGIQMMAGPEEEEHG